MFELKSSKTFQILRALLYFVYFITPRSILFAENSFKPLGYKYTCMRTSSRFVWNKRRFLEFTIQHRTRDDLNPLSCFKIVHGAVSKSSVLKKYSETKINNCLEGISTHLQCCRITFHKRSKEINQFRSSVQVDPNVESHNSN